MHHKRVVQEKNKLITDLKRLKKHITQYEPTLQQLERKYQLAMKEKARAAPTSLSLSLSAALTTPADAHSAGA